jgi:hypothetical protein
VFVNRDINIMFQGLNVSDSFLLMTRTREIVFRKPEQKTAAGTSDATIAGTETTTAPESSPAEPSASAKGPDTPAAPELSKSSAASLSSVAKSAATTITTTSTVTAIAAPTTTTATPMAMSASTTPIGRSS